MTILIFYYWLFYLTSNAEQATQSDLLNNINTLVRIEPMTTYEHGVQGFGVLESLLARDS